MMNTLKLFAALLFCAATGALAQDRPDDAQGLRVRIAADGGSVVLFNPGRDQLGIVRPGLDAQIKRIPAGGIEVREVFHVENALWIAVGPEAGEPVSGLRFIDAKRGRVIGRQYLGRYLLDAADLSDDLILYFTERDEAEILDADICRDITRRVRACEDRGRRVSGREQAYFGPPINDFVVDAELEMVIGTIAETGAAMSIDLLYGKILQEEWFKGAAPPMSVALYGGGEFGDRTAYLSSPAAGTVSILLIDPDFREFRPFKTIFVDDLASAPAPQEREAEISVAGDVPRSGDPVARVAASQDQSLILIGGVHSDVVHAMELVDIGALGRKADIRVDASIVDFDVAADGSRIAILTDRGLALVDRGELEEGSAANTFVRDDEQARRNAELTAAIQTKLAELGFYFDIVDGEFDQDTLAVLNRFAQQSGLRAVRAGVASELPPEVIATLFQHDLAALPASYREGPAWAETLRFGFDTFLRTRLPGLRHFNSSEVYTLGRDNAEAECSEANSYPDPAIWANITRPLDQLDRLRASFGQAVVIRATYQTAKYAECARTPAAVAKAAQEFRVISFEPKSPHDKDRELLQQLARRHAKDSGLDLVIAGPRTYLISPGRLVEEPGQWHTLIASHTPDERGCRFARDDVREFARLLADTNASGSVVYVMRTGRTPNYVVTIDTGDDEARARRLVSTVRRAAPRSDDGRTGIDSFVIRGNGAVIDGACYEAARIP